GTRPRSLSDHVAPRTRRHGRDRRTPYDYLQPFRHLDELRRGDAIRIVMPYGSFRYIVYDHEIVDNRDYDHEIVDNRDWSILRRRHFEKLVLTTCHPLYSAAQRFIVYARLARA